VEYARYLYYLHFAEGSIMPIRLMSLVFANVVKKAPLFARPFATGIRDNVEKVFMVRCVSAGNLRG
jgi:glutathione S-transferase